MIDSRAFSDFYGIDSSNQVPDGDTLGRFRNLLVRNGIQEKLFARVAGLLLERGLMLKKHQNQGEETGPRGPFHQEGEHVAL